MTHLPNLNHTIWSSVLFKVIKNLLSFILFSQIPMYWSPADFSGWFCPNSKSHKTFTIIMSKNQYPPIECAPGTEKYVFQHSQHKTSSIHEYQLTTIRVWPCGSNWDPDDSIMQCPEWECLGYKILLHFKMQLLQLHCSWT